MVLDHAVLAKAGGRPVLEWARAISGMGERALLTSSSDRTRYCACSLTFARQPVKLAVADAKSPESSAGTLQSTSCFIAPVFVCEDGGQREGERRLRLR